ncbi:unnamed protein product [Fusarium graminearum]|nr:hypothetical protein FGRA07_05032 [Fusarium graminearum]CAG1977983.1 unnamed protein product [Fusarium graminearum]VTO87182.1 unnamed protein product [Fusarium graminearum]
MKSSTTFLALVAAVHASPISKRDQPFDTKESLCKDKAWQLDTVEGASNVWETTGASDGLDNQIMGQWEHETNWLFNLEHAINNGSGNFGMSGCGLIASTDCLPQGAESCEEHFDKYGTSGDPLKDPIGRTSYWIFQAIKGMHSKFQMLHNELVEQTIITNLQIGEMVADFQGAEDKTEDVLKWLSAAVGLGSTIGGLVPGGAGEAMSTGFDIMGGVFDIIADATKPEEIDQGTISAALGAIFQRSSEQLKKTMRLATGTLEKGETADAFNSLPASKKYGPWIHSPITRFFNGGWFLLSDRAEPVQNLIKSISGNIKPKIANNVMKAANLRLVADKRVGSQEDCGYATGRQWMNFKDSEFYCFYIARLDEHGIYGEKYDEATEDIYANMAKYGLGNRDPYYRAVLDCATSGEAGLNPDNLGFNNIPVCFFDLPAYWLERNDGPECTSNMINKACNPTKSSPIA